MALHEIGHLLGLLTAAITLVARNGKGMETTSVPITVVYAPQLTTCDIASSEICGNKELGQVLTYTDDRDCGYKRSTVCEG